MITSTNTAIITVNPKITNPKATFRYGASFGIIFTYIAAGSIMADKLPPTPPVIFNIKVNAVPDANPLALRTSSVPIVKNSSTMDNTVCLPIGSSSLLVPVEILTTLYLMITKLTGMYRIRWHTTITLKKSNP